MRVIRRLQHPVVTAAAVVVLVMSVASIPARYSVRRSVIGEWLWARAGTASHLRIDEWYLRVEDERWVLLASPGESADAMSKAVAEAPHEVVSVRRQRGITGRGFYDPIFITRYDSIGATTGAGTPLAIERMRSLIEALNTFEGFEPMDATSAEYKTGWASVRVTFTRWGAVAHNVLAASALLILPISLGWIPRTIRERRELNRTAAGLCPGCGYDRSVTPIDAPCPECGREFLSRS
jgi:hypothetical protein